jgi:hypothetical protein
MSFYDFLIPSSYHDFKLSSPAAAKQTCGAQKFSDVNPLRLPGAIYAGAKG